MTNIAIRLMQVVLLFLLLYTHAYSADGAWYLSSTQLALAPANRLFSSVDVVNQSENPVYIKTRVDDLTLADGKRVRSINADEALIVSPEEFVVPPHAAVSVRVFSKAAAQQSRSYYVNFTDVSRAQSKSPGIGTAFVLAFDMLVSVAPELTLPSTGRRLAVSNGGGKQYHLQNMTTRHIYINGAFSCDKQDQPLVECEKILDFPKQSLLPDEHINFVSRPDLRWLGYLIYDNLNFTGGVHALIVPVGAKGDTVK